MAWHMPVEELSDQIEGNDEVLIDDEFADDVDEDIEVHELESSDQGVHAIFYEQKRIADIYMTKLKEIDLLSKEEELGLGKELQIARDNCQKIKNKIFHIKRELDVCTQNLLEDHCDQKKKLQQRFKALVFQEAEAEFCFISARNALVDRNLRLVVHYVTHYLNRGLSFLDLVQEGNLGLMKAAEKFEWRYGYRFSTYASWWIKQGIRRAIGSDSRTIRIPSYIYELLPRIIELQADFLKVHGREPTLDELAALSGCIKSRVENIISCAHATFSIRSLDVPLKNESDVLLKDNICDPDSDTYESVLARELEEMILKGLKILTDRQRDILERRHALGKYRGEIPATFKQIREEYDLSRQRIQQIEREAYNILKARFGYILREYWFN